MRVFLVAGEHSGDLLGGKLIEALKKQCPGNLVLGGVGGEHMAREGMDSLFPLSDVAVMGPLDILSHLPVIVRRVYQTVDAAIQFQPDILIIIDSPEFTHPIAKRFAKKFPNTPVLNYVSPSVWAWRPGRAKRMKRYISHVMALLPFEPAAYKRLDGPPCSYVGHPLIEKKDWLDALDIPAFYNKYQLDRERPVLVILPGSRKNEVTRLMPVFGDALSRLVGDYPAIQPVLPVVESVKPLVETQLSGWDIQPVIVEGEEDKFCAFRAGRAAMAASGTVTLQLALAGCPMVVGYKVDAIAIRLRWLVKVRSIILANLVLEENVFPELIQEDCEAEKLVPAVSALLKDTQAYRQQKEGLVAISDRLVLPGMTPSEAAAQLVLKQVKT